AYEECKQVISAMRFGSESELFGREKDDSFAGSIGNIYQSYAGQEIYTSLEEKAANLLYFVTKNHSFFDGNKRIAATMFLYFLDKNNVLFDEGRKLIDDYTLVALTIMIAESKPEEKEMMISVIMNCMK
ncbi:MAG: Fic family protein, partial [Lachnospiraceae bacterium]|nr:Fic family protein [Lachnospiraceae bacterium]